MDVPETIDIYKNKLPKGQSYPIQTSDLLKVLPENIKKLPIHLWYSNNAHWKTGGLAWCNLMSVRYRGDHNKNFDEINRLVFSVQPIPSDRRKDTRELFKRSILPVMSQWISEQFERRVQVDRVLDVAYQWVQSCSKTRGCSCGRECRTQAKSLA